MRNQDNSSILATQSLQPGMVIVRVIEQKGPVKIKKSGLVTSPEMIQGLIEMGIVQVEVDHQQTVEIEPDDAPVIKKSATRKMLESNAVTNSRIDDGLSEQFHRSLFLPSVQDMPSAWQYYARRYAQIAIIALGGFGVGLTLFNYSTVRNIFFSSLQTTSITPEQTSAGPTAMAVKPVELPDQPSTINEPSTLTVEANASPLLQNSKSETVADEALTKDKITKNIVVKESVAKDVEPPTVVDTPSPRISAELLNKFNKAIADVSDEPLENAYQNQPTQADVPRIDQLPAWILTTLPSMSFSAHMYASEPSERWVRVNGSRKFEGDLIDDKVKVIRIEPQHVVLEYTGQEFSMAALTDW